MTWEARSLPTRNINVGTPSTGEMVADSANCMRARGTLNLENRSPLASATSDTLTITSRVTSAPAPAPSGCITP
jgi:hypothetical protein